MAHFRHKRSVDGYRSKIVQLIHIADCEAETLTHTQTCFLQIHLCRDSNILIRNLFIIMKEHSMEIYKMSGKNYVMWIGVCVCVCAYVTVSASMRKRVFHLMSFITYFYKDIWNTSNVRMFSLSTVFISDNFYFLFESYSHTLTLSLFTKTNVNSIVQINTSHYKKKVLERVWFGKKIGSFLIYILLQNKRQIENNNNNERKKIRI